MNPIGINQEQGSPVWTVFWHNIPMTPPHQKFINHANRLAKSFQTIISGEIRGTRKKNPTPEIWQENHDRTPWPQYQDQEQKNPDWASTTCAIEYLEIQQVEKKENHLSGSQWWVFLYTSGLKRRKDESLLFDFCSVFFFKYFADKIDEAVGLCL